MEIASFVSIIRRRWWVLLGGPLLLGLLAYYYSDSKTPIYQASATLLVRNLADTSTEEPPAVDPSSAADPAPPPVALNDLLTQERIMETLAQLTSRRVVLEQVIQALELNISPGALASKISVEQVVNTQLIDIIVRDSNPELAAAIANETANAFITVMQEDVGDAGSLSIAERAVASNSPVSPDTTRTVVLIVIAGIFLSGLVALLLEYADDTVKSPEDVEAVTGHSTLGIIDRFRSRNGRRPVQLASAEDYRDLRTSIRILSDQTGLKTILVTSPGRREGRSRTVVNLGYMLAETGRTVLLVDADLRKPTLHEMTGARNSAGLSNLLVKDIPPPREWPIQSVDINLGVLAAGPQASNPSIISSSHMPEVMTELRAMADFVIIDSPALGAVTDASELARFVDGTIVLVEAGKTRSDALQAATATLERRDARIIGVVLNKGQSPRRRYRSYRRARGALDAEPERAAAPIPTTTSIAEAATPAPRGRRGA